jgi:DNA-binding MarR family transcriptional regulator
MKDMETYRILLEEIRNVKKRLVNIELIIQSEIDKSTPNRGVSMSEIIDLTPPERRLVLELIKGGRLTRSKIAERLGITDAEAEETAKALVSKGYLKAEQDGVEKSYEVSLARKGSSKVQFDVWGPLERKLD